MFEWLKRNSKPIATDRPRGEETNPRDSWPDWTDEVIPFLLGPIVPAWSAATQAANGYPPLRGTLPPGR